MFHVRSFTARGDPASGQWSYPYALFWPNWERAANDTVALLRAEAGRDPYDRGPSDLNTPKPTARS